MTLLILGLVLFLGVHSVAFAAPRLRAAAVAKLGEGPWKGIYSLVAAVGLVLIFIGYGQARRSPVVLYLPPYWTRHVAMLLMLPVFVLIAAAYLPARMRVALKHPMLVGVKLWTVAHLIANGMLADVLLFGGFLVWAVLDRLSLRHRRQGPPMRAAVSARYDLIAIALGLVVYVLTITGLHRHLIGVPVLPAISVW